MSLRIWRFPLLGLFLAASLVGCAMSQTYDVILKNGNYTDIDDVAVQFEPAKPNARALYFHLSGLGPRILASYGMYPLSGFPLPPHATASWTTPDGVRHRQVIAFTPELTPRHGEDIVFFFNKDSVTVKLVPQSDFGKLVP